MAKVSVIKLLFKYKYEVLLLLIAALLLFSNLGDRTLGGDETFGMEIATNILSHGTPLIRDNLSINYNLTTTVNSPFSEYLMAGSTALFGFSEFAARLPAAIFGFLSLILIYFFVLRLSNNRRTSLLALLLSVFSIIFYLHARYARYYSIALFFNLLFIYAFYEYFIRKSSGKWKYVLIASACLLFYTHPETAFYTSTAAVLWLILKRKDLKLKQVVAVLVPILVIITPLFLLMATSKTYQLTATGLPPLLQQNFLSVFALYAGTGIYYFFLFFVPLIFLLILPKALKKYNKSILLLLLLIILSHIFVASLISPFGTPSIRKLFVGTFPIDIFLLATALNYLLERKSLLKPAAIILLVLLVFTNFVFLFPLALFKGPISNLNTQFIPEATKESFVEKTLEPRYYLADFIYEISHHYESPMEKILSAINTGSPGDKILYPNGFSVTPYTNRLGMIVSYNVNDLNSTVFDWIILGPQDRIPTLAQNYEKTTYSIPSYDDPWIDTADPVHHRFSSDSAPGVNITIYHLVK